MSSCNGVRPYRDGGETPMRSQGFAHAVVRLGLVVIGILGLLSTASSNDEIIRLSQSDENWVMQCKDNACARYSKMTDIDTDNVERFRPAWSFSTGVLHGHEGGPLVVNGIMYIHTPFPNNTFAFDLERPGEILWEHKPKQDPAARAVACCGLSGPRSRPTRSMNASPLLRMSAGHPRWWRC